MSFINGSKNESLTMHYYDDRELFLIAIVDCLNSANAPDVFFTKVSPEPLPESSLLIQSLKKKVKEGGTLTLVIQEGPRVGEWLGDTVKVFSDCSRVCIAIIRSINAIQLPAMIVGGTDVFLHAAWPTQEMPELPYVGIHFSGRDIQLQHLVASIKSLINQLVHSPTALVLKR